MAGVAKSCYLSVTDRITYKVVVNKMFFTMTALNEFINTDEFKEKYPRDKYEITKETY